MHLFEHIYVLGLVNLLIYGHYANYLRFQCHPNPQIIKSNDDDIKKS